jgi:taurine dioxygenase
MGRRAWPARLRRRQNAITEKKDRYVNAEIVTQDAVHPVVIRHPETGRHTLYVNASFTTHFEGWTEKESKSLLEYLYTPFTSLPENRWL